MENKDPIKELSEEVKKKLAACGTGEEARKILSEAGVEPLSDEDLDKVAGGLSLSYSSPDKFKNVDLSHTGLARL